MSSHHRATLLFLALSTLGACVISAQPSPPSLDIERVGTVDVAGEDTFTTLVGGPGAVAPAAGVLVLTPLTIFEPERPLVAPVMEDGSFVIRGPRGPARFQVRQGASFELRSAPVDVVLSGGAPQRLELPLEGCLRIPVELDLGAAAPGEVDTLEVVNTCDRAVEVLAGLRVGRHFALDAPGPVTIPAHGRAAWSVISFPDGAATGPVEDTLLFRVTGFDPGLRAVTLFVAP